MARFRMLLSAVSLALSITCSWPTAGSGAAKSCAENMNEIYKQVETLDLHDHLTNEAKKASVRGKAQESTSTIPSRHSKRPARRKRRASQISRMGIISRSWRQYVRNEKGTSSY